MSTKFIDTLSVKLSDEESRKFAQEKVAFEEVLSRAVDSAYPELSTLAVCHGLNEAQRKAVSLFLQMFGTQSLSAATKRKTLKFSADKTGSSKAASLRKRGFPAGDFTWKYQGVTDFGTESTMYCSLSGHPIRYGHSFVTKGAPVLCLSSGSASALFGVEKEVFDSIIYAQTGLLRSVAEALCAGKMGRGNDYLKYLCGRTGTFLLHEGFDSIMDLVPYYVDNSVFESISTEVPSDEVKVFCKSATGTRVHTYGWIRDHIYVCANASLDADGVLTACEVPPASCVNALKAMVDPILGVNEFISVGLLPPKELCAPIDKGLTVGVSCHRMPERPEVIEDVKDNWKYSINGGVLTLERYIGTNPDVVVRNTYLAEGKKFTKVTLMETMVTFDSDGDVRSIDAGVFVSNKGLKSIVFEEGILLPEKCWYMFYGCASLKSLDLSNLDTSNVTNMGDMFGNCESLKSLDLSSFDTSRVTDMPSMFFRCISLESLDLSSFDTSSVTDMRRMFRGCESLKSLDLSHFDTSKVTNMHGMLEYCSSLKSLDLSSFDTSRVTDMGYMFHGCKSLKSLDLSYFDTSKVTVMLWMFCGCSSLESLDLSNFDTSKVTDMEDMFYGCRSLKSLDLSSFDTSSVTGMGAMFKGSVIGTLYFWGTRRDWAVWKSKPERVGLVICKDDEEVKDNWEYSVDGDVLTLEKYIGTNPDVVVRNTYLAGGKKFTKVALMETKVTLKSTGYWKSIDAGVFAENTGLKSIVFEKGILLPEKCWYMFWDCSSLKSLDLSHFDTSKVTNMSGMFGGCISLKSLDLNYFDTSRVTDMRCMFQSCISLDSLDLSHFDTSRVTVMAAMFWDCSPLKSLDLSSFDTSSVTTMESMFDSCSSLESLDLSHFDTSSVTDMDDMFCYSVIGTLYFWGTRNDWDVLESKPKSVGTLICTDDSPVEDVKGNWEYSVDGDVLTLEKYIGMNPDVVVRNTYMAEGKKFTKVALMESKVTLNSKGDVESVGAGVFAKNEGLKSIVFEDGVLLPENCVCLFSDCSSLESLDLSNLNTSNVTDMGAMFSYCSSLKSLDLSNFDTSSVTDMRAMFDSCRSLESLNLRSFDTSSVTNIRSMFSVCHSLKFLDLSHFDTSRVTDLWSVFWDSVIGTLYFWGTRRDWAALVWTPDSVGTLICKDDSPVEDVEDVKDNWEYSINGDVLTLEKYIGASPAVVVRNTYMADGKTFTKVALMETKVTFDSDGDVESIDAGVFVRNEGLKSIVFEEGILLPEKCWFMFYACSSLEFLDLSYFDTSRVTDMMYMFWGCTSLKSLDLSTFDTSRVIDMGDMFYGCSSLKYLDLSSFDTSKVIGMWSMFRGCSSLESLDLSNFDTSRVTNMWAMFMGCRSLESLDLSHFDTSKVTKLGPMFDDCSSLKSLDLSSFDTSKVTDMWGMFDGCSSLESLNLSSFDTSSVTDMRRLFGDSVIGTLYFWGTRSAWAALKSKPDSVGILICKDDSPSTFLKSCMGLASGAKSTKGLVLCTVRLLSRQDLSGLSSVSVGSDFASGRGFSFGSGSVGLGSGSGLSVYVDESDPSLVHFWVPADMVPMVERMLKSVGTVEYVSDSSGRRISPSEFNAMSGHTYIDASVDVSDGGSAVASDDVLGSSDLGLDFEGVSFESEGYRRLYSLVEDAYGFFTCDVEALRASGDEYAGKTDLGIRRAQLFEVKVLDPAVECALYARELRYPLPDGVQLSSAGLSVLGEYESTRRASRLVLKVLRTECYNAGLLFTASGLLKGVLELLRESEMRDLLRSTSEEMLVDRLVQLLSNYQVVRSGILTVLVGLYRMVEARGAVNLKSRIAKLYNLAKAGAVPSKKLSVQAILDSEKG